MKMDKKGNGGVEVMSTVMSRKIGVRHEIGWDMMKCICR